MTRIYYSKSPYTINCSGGSGGGNGAGGGTIGSGSIPCPDDSTTYKTTGTNGIISNILLISGKGGSYTGRGGSGGNGGAPGQNGFNGVSGIGTKGLEWDYWYGAGYNGTSGGLAGYYINVKNNKTINWLKKGYINGRYNDSSIPSVFTACTVISTNTSNYNVLNDLVAQGWNKSSPIDMTILINSNVTVTSTISGIPAISISSQGNNIIYPNTTDISSNITIINNGIIQGFTLNGIVGNAIETHCPLTIDNKGTINGQNSFYIKRMITGVIINYINQGILIGNLDSVAIDCKLSDWNAYGDCTQKSDGKYYKTRNKTIVVAPNNGGASCGITSEDLFCPPVDCTLLWGNTWGPCTMDNNQSYSYKYATVTSPAQYGGTCPSTVQRSLCNLQLTVSNIQTDFNVWDICVQAHKWNTIDPINVIVTVTSTGVLHQNTGDAAFTTGNHKYNKPFPSGSTIKLIIQAGGKIFGKGGNGGNGGYGWPDNTAGLAGTDGGDAILLTYSVTIENNGFIAGGGGGGGGGAADGSYYGRGGGGGGGAGMIVGIGGLNGTNASYTTSYVFTPGAGGTASGNGGRGGNLGQDGTKGEDKYKIGDRTWPGGNGGKSGSFIKIINNTYHTPILAVSGNGQYIGYYCDNGTCKTCSYGSYTTNNVCSLNTSDNKYYKTYNRSITSTPASQFNNTCKEPLSYTENCPPINCVVSDWTKTKDCTLATNGNWYETHNKTIITQAANGGTVCPSDLSKQVLCSKQDCSVGNWYDMTPCPGPGIIGYSDYTYLYYKNEIRDILQIPTYGGTSCPTDLTRTTLCPCNLACTSQRVRDAISNYLIKKLSKTINGIYYQAIPSYRKAEKIDAANCKLTYSVLSYWWSDYYKKVMNGSNLWSYTGNFTMNNVCEPSCTNC
jgi:hypothetical protein